MKNILKKSLSVNRTLLILSLICLLLGVLSCTVGELLLPFLIGALSALYLFDTRSKQTFSIIVSVLLLALNVASLLLGYAVSLFAPAAVVMSLIASFAFKKDQSKSDAAYVMTIISAIFSVAGYILYAMIEQGVFTLDAAVDYYTQIIELLRVIFVQGITEIYVASGIEISEEIITAIFDQQISMIISYLLIGGFIISGVAMKVFGLIVGFLSEDKTYIKQWRFTATRAYAYFYILLVILSLFATEANSIFAVSVMNLYNIFMVIFAYVGFKVAYDMLKKRRKPVVAALILCGALLLFSTFAAQILAAFGALYAMKKEESQAQN